MDAGSNALIKAVVADFETAQGRSTARELMGSKPAEIKVKCIETLRQAGVVVDAKAPGEALAFTRAGCYRSASTLPRLPRRADFQAWRRAGEQSREGDSH
jgi:hypothetical protein